MRLFGISYWVHRRGKVLYTTSNEILVLEGPLYNFINLLAYAKYKQVIYSRFSWAIYIYFINLLAYAEYKQVIYSRFSWDTFLFILGFNAIFIDIMSLFLAFIAAHISFIDILYGHSCHMMRLKSLFLVFSYFCFGL